MGSRVTYIHSIIMLSVACLSLFAPPVLGSFVSVLCLCAVATIGVSHGALDYVKGRAVLKTLSKGAITSFYFAYIAVAVMTLVCWYVSSGLLLTVFLTLAAYHFGKEDASGVAGELGRMSWVVYLMKGGAVVMAPLCFHPVATESIFRALDLSVIGFVTPTIAFYGLCGSALAGIALARKANIQGRVVLMGDLLSVIVLNYALPPLVAFTVYFCGLHSIRHGLELAHDVDDNLLRGILAFLRKALPLTVVTMFSFGIIFLVLLGRFDIDESVNKVIFLGLAALTFPHVLLEYLFERRVLAGS